MIRPGLPWSLRDLSLRPDHGRTLKGPVLWGRASETSTGPTDCSVTVSIIRERSHRHRNLKMDPFPSLHLRTYPPPLRLSLRTLSSVYLILVRQPQYLTRRSGSIFTTILGHESPVSCGWCNRIRLKRTSTESDCSVRSSRNESLLLGPQTSSSLRTNSSVSRFPRLDPDQRSRELNIREGNIGHLLDL